MGEMYQIEDGQVTDAAPSALETMVVHLQHLLGDAISSADISGGQIILRTTSAALITLLNSLRDDGGY